MNDSHYMATRDKRPISIVDGAGVLPALRSADAATPGVGVYANHGSGVNRPPFSSARQSRRFLNPVRSRLRIDYRSNTPQYTQRIMHRGNGNTSFYY